MQEIAALFPCRTARRRIGLVLASPLHPAGLAAIARQGVGALRRRLRGGKDEERA